MRGEFDLAQDGGAIRLFGTDVIQKTAFVCLDFHATKPLRMLKPLDKKSERDDVLVIITAPSRA